MMTEEMTADQFNEFETFDIVQPGALESQISVNALEGIGIDPIERRGSLLTAQNIFGSMVHQAHPDVIQDGPNESADLLD